MPTISVVVPVYKVEPYLRRCVDSILQQTYRDFELILVDDGSPDSCGSICDAYAQTDRRIHVIHQKNGGLSAARNAGIDWVFGNSDSRWFTFIDSDDWIHPQTLERLLQAAEAYNTAVSVCGYAETAGENPAVTAESMCACSVDPRWFYCSRFINATVAWGKLYRRELFENVRYPVGKIHEDEFVTYRLLMESGRIAVLEAPLYAYFVNPAGITKKGWSPRKLHAWEAYEQQIAFFEERRDAEMVKFRYRGYLENALVNLQQARESNADGQYDKEVKEIENRIRQVIRRAWKKDVLSFREDFELLYRFYPLLTRGYRFWLERILKK